MAGMARLALCLRPLTALGQVEEPAAPAVKRAAEEDWGRDSVAWPSSRELIRARTGHGRARAKARGVKFGRPSDSLSTAGSPPAPCDWRSAGRRRTDVQCSQATEITNPRGDCRESRGRGMELKQSRKFDPASLACTRFRRHRVRCFDGAGGVSWRDGSLPASSSLRLCA
jgi:hypothetical protein